MKCSDGVGDRADQSNSYGNEEIPLDGAWNQRNPLDQSWTEKDRFGRDADLLKEEQQTIIKYNWKGTREALTSTCQEVLCCKKYHHKEWMSIEAVDKIQEMKNKKTAPNNSRTRAWKHKSQAEYTKASKQVKKNIRANKQKFVKQLVVTVKKAAIEGNMRELYDRAEKLAGKYSKPE
ncbi:unnamed protein product [Schistosoma margrebowiei]|uniref:Uncharacterized protein n=1 Tax=Schistosoma margrebowiei TaxID=48269 RepID=A0A183MNT0_9TREM|nr:unnamed protein product [Schistosoma margrebowiei]